MRSSVMQFSLVVAFRKNIYWLNWNGAGNSFALTPPTLLLSKCARCAILQRCSRRRANIVGYPSSRIRIPPFMQTAITAAIKNTLQLLWIQMIGISARWTCCVRRMLYNDPRSLLKKFPYDTASIGNIYNIINSAILDEGMRIRRIRQCWHYASLCWDINNAPITSGAGGARP